MPIPTAGISTETKAILHKLSTPEAVSVMEEMLNKAASSNNSTNFAKPGSDLTHDQMVQKLQSLPEGSLRNILQTHGIL